MIIKPEYVALLGFLLILKILISIKITRFCREKNDEKDPFKSRTCHSIVGGRIRTAGTLTAKLGITERTAYTYIKKLKNGKGLDREKSIRKTTVMTTSMAQRIVRSVKNSKKAQPLRDIAVRFKISHESVRKILHNEGISYRRRSQKKTLNDIKHLYKTICPAIWNGDHSFQIYLLFRMSGEN